MNVNKHASLERLYLLPQQVNGLLNALKKFTPAHAIDQSMELECRFGHYDADSHFTPMVRGESFNLLLRAFQANGVPVTDCQYQEAIEVDGKRFLFKDDTLVQKEKTVLSKLDVKQYGCRLALSQERQTDVLLHGTSPQVILQQVASGNKAFPFIMYKRRWSCDLGLVRYDLTMLERYETHGPKEAKKPYDVLPEQFTIEVELLPTLSHVKDPNFTSMAYNDLLVHMEKVIHLLDRTPYPTDTQESQDVTSYIKKKLKSTRPFMQAVTLRKKKDRNDTMPNLRKHMATLKLDGERALFVVMPSTQCYLYCVNGQVIRTCLQAPLYVGSVFDCEWVDERHLFLFDSLIVRDVDVRPNMLYHRLSHVSSLMTETNFDTTLFFQVHRKLYFGQSMEDAHRLAMAVPLYKQLPNDGWIFTQTQEPYKAGICSSLLKWKPSVTVDLRVDMSHGLYLRTYDSEDSWMDSTTQTSELFGQVKLHHDKWNKFCAAHVVYSGLVVEFEIERSSPFFILVPLRARYDKPHPNTSYIIKDNLDAVEENVTVNELLKRELVVFHVQPESSSNQQVGKELHGVRQFHNMIKRHLLNQYTAPGKDLLDYCCGRLGDLTKWRSARLKSVVGIDINEEYLTEARSRLKVQHLQHTQVELYHGDVTACSIASIVQDSNRLFDHASCFFAVHYFFQEPRHLETVFDNINAHLRVGGTFMMTCFDGQRVLDFMGAEDHKCLDDSIFIQKRYQLMELDPTEGVRFGWAIETGFGTKETMLKDVSHEFLVFVEPFLKWICERYQWSVKLCKPFNVFEGYRELKPQERAYSDLHVAIVLKKEAMAIDVEGVVVDEEIDMVELFGEEEDESVIDNLANMSLQSSVHPMEVCTRSPTPMQTLMTMIRDKNQEGEASTSTAPPKKSVTKKTVAQLKELCTEKGIRFKSKDTKGQLIEHLAGAGVSID